MSALIDLTGRTYGLLTVQRLTRRKTAPGGARAYVYYMCKCSCGAYKEIRGETLRRGYVQSCGCLRSLTSSATMHANAKERAGQRFGRLTVIERDYMHNRRGAHWVCKCDCGQTKTIAAMALRRRDAKSCGCMQHATKLDREAQRQNDR